MRFILPSPLTDCFFKALALPSVDLVVQHLRQQSSAPASYISLFRQDPGLMLQLLLEVKAGEELDLSQIYESASQEQVFGIIDWASDSQPLPINLPGPDYYLFWRTSLHRSVLVRKLARLAGHGSLEESLFTVGLLQEAALPMMLLCLDDQQTLSFPGFHVSLHTIIEWSRLSFDVDHRLLGEEKFKRWGLPKLLQQSQSLELGKNLSPDVLLLELARQAVESFYAVEVELSNVQENAMSWFGISPEQLNLAIADSLDSLSELSLNRLVHEELDSNWSNF